MAKSKTSRKTITKKVKKNSFKQRVASTACYRALQQVKNLGKYNWLLVLFDLLFVLSVYGIVGLSYLVFSQGTAYAVQTVLGSFTSYFFIAAMILYVALLLFTLAFFRYSITDIMINQLETKLDVKRVLKLYALNLSVFAVFFISLLAVINLFEFAVRRDFFPYLRDASAAAALILYYFAYNATATLFFRESPSGFSSIFSQVFAIVFSRKLWKLMIVFLTFVISLGIFFILYFGIFILTKSTVFRTDPLYFENYVTLSAFVFILFAYLAVFFNRFYFMELFEKLKQEK